MVRRWLRAGADGWRLDVADELPDDFVHGVHAAAGRRSRTQWSSARCGRMAPPKVAYGVRRRHILGALRRADELPFRGAALDYLRGGDARDFMEAMETLRENYPRFAFYSAMNSPGYPRYLPYPHPAGRGERVPGPLSGVARWLPHGPGAAPPGKELLKLGAVLLFAFPGSPRCTTGMRRGWRALRTLQPSDLPLGPRGPGAAGLVHPPGPSASGVRRPAPGRYPLSGERRAAAGLYPHLRGGDGPGRIERRGSGCRPAPGGRGAGPAAAGRGPASDRPQGQVLTLPPRTGESAAPAGRPGGGSGVR